MFASTVPVWYPSPMIKDNLRCFRCGTTNDLKYHSKRKLKNGDISKYFQCKPCYKESRQKYILNSDNSELRTCEICSKEFVFYNTSGRETRGRYCSVKCKVEWTKTQRFSKETEFKKEHKPWNKGIEWHNVHYKGDQVGNRALHTWVQRRLGKPSLCEHCATTEAKRFEWSNISRQYKRELTDWQRLCSKCHQNYDGHGIENNKRKIT